MSVDRKAKEEQSSPRPRTKSGVVPIERHERMELHPSFRRTSFEERQADVAERAERRLAAVRAPDQAEVCAAWYAAHREVATELWQDEAGWDGARLARAREMFAGHLGGESPDVRHAFIAVGIIEAVYTSLMKDVGPRVDLLAGAVIGKREDAMRALLSRVWRPFKEWATACEASASADPELFGRVQAVWIFLPEVEADAFRAVDGLVEHWIGEEECAVYLERYQAFRKQRAAAGAPCSPAAAAQVDAAWAQVAATYRANDEFFASAANLLNLIVSLGDASRVGRP